MFESTLPFGQPELMRVSAFKRYLSDATRPATEQELGHSRMSTLSPSLMLDLARFEQNGRHTEVLEVLAASMRHGRSLLIHLQCDHHVVPLTVFPVENLAHCPMPVEQLLSLHLTDIEVLHVERALLRPPGLSNRVPAAEVRRYTALRPVLWELALRGARDELLPEIAGQVAYRISPGVDLRDLDLSGALAAAVARLQRDTTNLRDICTWPGFDHKRAVKLLNALYLQAGLMVSRTHPAATNEGWSRSRN